MNPTAQIPEIRRMVTDTMGRVFRCAFITADGRERWMRARLVKTDAETVRNDLLRNNVTVYDLEKKAQRRIPLERLVWFRCGEVNWLTSVGGHVGV